jgi:hypothetical protein
VHPSERTALPAWAVRRDRVGLDMAAVIHVLERAPAVRDGASLAFPISTLARLAGTSRARTLRAARTLICAGAAERAPLHPWQVRLRADARAALDAARAAERLPDVPPADLRTR